MEDVLKQAVLSSLGYKEKNPSSISVQPVSGGSINQAAKIVVNGKPFFVKWNDAARYPLMFELEAKGLGRLASVGGTETPTVLAVGHIESHAFLVLEWIESKPKAPDFWTDFGTGLAKIHQITQSQFGLDEDNYIGSLFQPNDPMDDWVTFYITQRLDFQMEQAYDAGYLQKKHLNQFQELYKALPDLLPIEKPALLHGDLWSGNYLVGNNGEPVLIDPAVYYGHREMDLAMMKLFGGFNMEVFRAYNEKFPLEKGWQERIPIHQLYPLLVHVNLFGLGYVGQVQDVLRRFT